MGSHKNELRDSVHFKADCVQFRLYSKEEILKLSVVEIFNPAAFNQLGHPLDNGLYDLKMGPFSDRNPVVCGTCHLQADFCPGHIGHIALPMPAVNPLFYADIQKVLKISCIHCHRFKMAECFKTMFQGQMKLLDLGLINQAQEVGDMVNRREDSEDKKSGKMNQDEESSLDIKLKNYIEEELRNHEVQHKMKLGLFKGEVGNRTVETLRKEYVKKMWGRGKDPTCGRCGATTRKILRQKTGFVYEGLKRDEYMENIDEFDEFRTQSKRQSRGEQKERIEINPQELLDHFRVLYIHDKQMIDNLFPVFTQTKLKTPTDLLFIQVLPVPPPRSRPAQITESGLTLHPQTTALQEVLHAIVTMKQLLQIIQGTPIESFSTEIIEMLKSLKGGTPAGRLDNVWKELQLSVDHVLDKNLNSAKAGASVNGWGLKQLIERKQGIFRMNMMGKRVNYACRTVITPDPNINIDEIGVPEIFAKRLSYPVPVTPWNFKELRQMVLNGPDKHPGALVVEDEFGKPLNLETKDPSQRLMIANTLMTPTYSNKKSDRPKIVHRHLRNGDAMLLNRQPTLHKPSIMAHKARVLKGEKVMRLHYSNCKSYNADFDGDEMNAHFPQSETARSEAYNIALSSHQYLGPKDGTPLQGLIQDHVIGAVKMTLRGRFFSRPEYMQLVFQALQGIPGRIKIQAPTIFKPEQLWSGKQVISTILINLVPPGKFPPNFTSTAKINPKLWQSQPERAWKAGGTPLKKIIDMSESEFIVRDGILCVGILDKNQFGATPYSLAHLLFELYGGGVSTSFLSGLSKLFTYFLQGIEGFSLGVQDILVTETANDVRTGVMADTRQVGDSCAAQGVGAKGEVNIDELRFMMEETHRASADNPRFRMELDRGYKEKLNPATNRINAVCVPAGLIKSFPHNNLQLMVNSGAKGSTVNTTQISCLLGQIELEGKRPPIMISGKSLPSFRPYDTQPRAGGFIDGRFMTGIQPPEFFFHCMAGREGLIDTAVKTSRSGYLQRCLIKLLEGLTVHQDYTVRDSDNSVIQFQYGEDSLDVCKSQYIKPSRLKDLSNNINSVMNKEREKRAKEMSDMKGIKKEKKKLKEWKKYGGGERKRTGAFLKFSECSDTLKKQFKGYEKIKVGKEDPVLVSRAKSYLPTLSEYRNLNDSIKADLEESQGSSMPPLSSTFLPPVHFSAITEACDAMISEYIKQNKDTVDSHNFKNTMYLKIQESCVAAGEPVGVLAAQSVGEPSTQMTLNTFHFAGRGEMNVTLGIPRLREILMVASDNIKTPSLTIPFKQGITQKEMDKFRLKFNKVVLENLLEEVQVTEMIVLSPARLRKVVLRFKFLPYKYYKQDYGVTQHQVLQYMENKFFNKVFFPVMVAVSKEKKVGVDVGQDMDLKIGHGGGGGGDRDDDEGESGDVTKERRNEETADKAMGDVESSDDEQEDMEGEGTDVTRKVERQGDREYEELEEVEIKIKDELVKQEDDEYNEDKDDVQPESSPVSEDENYESEEDEDDDRNETIQDELMSSGEPRKRRAEFLEQMEGVCGLCGVSDYSYDTEKERWCEITLSFDISQKRIDMPNILRKSAERGLIYQIKNMKKGFVIEKDGRYMIQTDGINIDVMLHYDKILDLNNLMCNNIHDMARYYGIEAAYKTIVREVTNVFGVYGIEVDYRHLSLIADYMTQDGRYRPFNRIGIESNPSPFQQMTFETAMGFLRSSTLGARSDELNSPSACIVLGKPTKGGTGSVNLRYAL